MYIIDEQRIIDHAKNLLPPVEEFNKRIIVVYVNDFIGYINIWISDMFKPRECYYYVVFQKSLDKNNRYYWDFIGYDKEEILIVKNDEYQ